MEWWKEKVMYQVYPRSFADSNGDGMGDLKGITSKLDYLKDLGIGGIWLSPHYPSPFLDCGYDVADYCAIGEEYGNMDDFKEFLEEAHRRDIKVILDLVMNHTSDQHPWFLESKSSKDNPKRDWYVWEKNSGDYPNDWQSCFGGSSWTLDKETDEYFYHFFLKEQPDLNWRNPEVKKAMFDSMRFWLDMGVDGFRIDAITSIFEDETLQDQGWTPDEYREKIENPEDGDFLQSNVWEYYMRHQIKQPELHGLLQEMRALADSYDPPKFLVGELSDLEYLGKGDDELHMVFNFPLMQKGIEKDIFLENQRDRLPKHPVGAWQGNTLSNHDVSRIRSKYAQDDIKSQAIKHAAFLMLTMKGTPYLYYGEELGMKNHSMENLEDFRDLRSVNLYHHEIERGLSHEDAMKAASNDTRDRCRTPMPWNSSENAGFSPKGIKTWLPVDPEYKNGVNVEDQLKDKNSVLNYYRSLINFRNRSPVLQHGEYSEVESKHDELLIFERKYKGDKLYCIINYSSTDMDITSLLENSAELVWGLEDAYNSGKVKSGEAVILQ